MPMIFDVIDIFGIMDEMYSHGVYEIDILAIFYSLFVGKKIRKRWRSRLPVIFFFFFSDYI